MNKNNERAKHVLDSLIQGLDPETGDDLPKESILQRVEVVRAFLVCKAALEDVGARTARRAQLPSNIGKAWSEAEKQQLSERFQSGTPIAEIAAAHGRTVRAIEARLEVMGLITADERTTSNRDQREPS